MDLQGWILKVDVDIKRNQVVIVMKDVNGSYIEIPLYHTPKIYIGGDKEEIIRIIRGFRESILDVYTEEWRVPPWYDKKKDVYVLRFTGIDEYYRFLRYVRGIYNPDINLYNTAPSIPQRFLMEIGVSPSLLVNIHFNGGRIEAEELEDRENIDYDPPPFKRISIKAFTWYGEIYNPWRKKPDGYTISTGNGEEAIELSSIDALIDYVHEIDPDVMEYSSLLLHKWLMKHKAFREEMKRRRRVYVDYGATVLEPSEYHGLIELSRLSYTDIGRVSKYSIGKILTTIEAIEAIRRGMAVPEYRVDIERPKRIDMLYTVDRGGLYYIPSPGLYWNVAQCDFTSLYPNIIVKYNISNETVNRCGCREYIDTPIGIHKICMDIKGIVPIVLEKLIARRVALKDLAKKTGDPIAKARQNAIKWILVACFGYLGYRNARFGKIEAYESVTAYARYILNKTIKIARKSGFRVIHAIVDSIWITKKDATLDEYRELCRRISGDIGIRMELDVHYKWLYLPRNVSRPPVAQANRYYGVGYNGEIKVKGIELVRRDTPLFIKKFQMDAINMIAGANNESQMSIQLKKIMDLYREYVSELINGDMDVRDLLITRRVPRRWDEYRGRNLFIDAIKKYKLHEGEIVRFIVTSNREAIPIEYWRESIGYSRSYYLTRLNKSLSSLPLEYMKIETCSLEKYL